MPTFDLKVLKEFYLQFPIKDPHNDSAILSDSLLGHFFANEAQFIQARSLLKTQQRVDKAKKKLFNDAYIINNKISTAWDLGGQLGVFAHQFQADVIINAFSIVKSLEVRPTRTLNLWEEEGDSLTDESQSWVPGSFFGVPSNYHEQLSRLEFQKKFNAFLKKIHLVEKRQLLGEFKRLREVRKSLRWVKNLVDSLIIKITHFTQSGLYQLEPLVRSTFHYMANICTIEKSFELHVSPATCNSLNFSLYEKNVPCRNN